MNNQLSVLSRSARLLLAALVLLTALLGGAAPALAAAPGTVVAWGSDFNGQSSVPAGLSNVTAIAGGESQSLALKSDGTVVAWGCVGFDFGQCSIPDGLSNVTAIAASGLHNLALKNDGTVVSWGHHDFGQTSVPAGLSNVTAIATGYSHSLALKSDGTVVAWGYNFAEQTSVPAGLSNVTAIEGGYYHSLVLKSDGTVVAWGDDEYGQTSVPAGLSNVTAIAAGYYHNLALKSDGTVVAWGDDEYGQTSVPAGLSNVTAIAGGYGHSLALKSDGTVVAWGCVNFDFGQCNLPPGLSNVTAIAAGGDHSLALVPSDTTPPVITANVVGTQGDNGWYVSDVTVSWSVTDAQSAITSQSDCDAMTVDADTTGITFTCSAASAGGSNSQSVTIKRDATAPTIAGAASPAPNANSWNNSDVTVTFTCNDATSGVASCGPSQALTGDGANQSASGTVTDNAGNSASASVNGINIDKTAPGITFANRTPAPNANGWNNSDVTLNWDCADALSGPASASVNQTLSGEGANQSAAGTCADNAGNTASDTQTGINIDTTAPTLAPSVSPNPIILGGSATVTSGAADVLSGLASQSCGTLDTSSVGVKSVSCTATDNAGNTASASVTYQVAYRWSGFFQPIDNLPTVNSVKAGQAIPVKFSLGGNYGLNIFASGYPKVQQVACGSGAPIDEVEQTVTAGASGLSYDAASDTYTYVWKTQKSWAGTCRQLAVRLIDGSEHIASFTFK
jgi:hypothetical protein